MKTSKQYKYYESRLGKLFLYTQRFWSKKQRLFIHRQVLVMPTSIEDCSGWYKYHGQIITEGEPETFSHFCKEFLVKSTVYHAPAA